MAATLAKFAQSQAWPLGERLSWMNQENIKIEPWYKSSDLIIIFIQNVKLRKFPQKWCYVALGNITFAWRYIKLLLKYKLSSTTNTILFKSKT